MRARLAQNHLGRRLLRDGRLNSVALLGALTGPIAFGMTADFVGLRWALAATTVVPLAWMSSLALRVRSGIRGGG